MDSLLWAFVGMVVSFLAIYIFISRKFGDQEISEQFGHKRKFSDKYNMAKQGILILKKKGLILKTFESLPPKDQKEVLTKLQQIKDSSQS